MPFCTGYQLNPETPCCRVREREKEREKDRERKSERRKHVHSEKGGSRGEGENGGNLAADRAGGGKQNRPTLCALETKR